MPLVIFGADNLHAKLDDAQLRAIGAVAVQWSHLESIVHSLFSHAIGSNLSAGRLVAGHIRRVRVLLKILSDLAPFAPDDMVAVEKLRAEIGILEDKRDDVIHRAWWKRVEAPDQLKGLLETRVAKHDPRETTAEAIRALADEIGKMVSALFAFYAERYGLQRLL